MDDRARGAGVSAEAPGGGAEAAGTPPARERRAAALTHASALLMFFLPLGNLLGPVLAFAAARGRRPFLARHAAQAVAYQAGVCAAAWTLFVLGETRGFGSCPHLGALLLSLLPSAWAAARAWRGSPSAYPWIGRWVPPA